MKKLLTLSIITMFLMSMLVIAAPPVPKPIRGYFKINGVGLAGYIIEVTNARTGETISGDDYAQLITQSNGFAFDLSYFSQGYAEPIEGIYPGDVITVQVRGFGSEGKISFNVPSETPFEITIAITTGETILYCDDGTLVLDLANCPVEEEEEPEPELEDETKVVSSDDKSSASVEAYLGQTIDVCVTDSKIVSLLDKEIKYDGESYDIHEESCFKGVVETSLYDEDFGLNPYFIVLSGDVTYGYYFEDALPFEDIHAEEPLDIVILGEDYKIIYAEDDLIVLRTGKTYFVKEGDTAGGVEVIAIGENSVSVKVNGVTEIIGDGSDRLVNGLNIQVNEILYKSYEDSFVELIIGTEGDQEIKDGDDFADKEDFKWVISLPDYIGVVNQQDYVSIDEDEEYKAIEIGQGISLPNDYLNFNFKGISESDVVDLTFKVDDGYLNVKGDSGSDAFVFGSDEYDEINVKAEGIYDEDEVLITSDKVRIGDSDTYLEMGSIKIGLLTIKLDMSDILYDGISYLAEEGNFLDYFGIIFKDPENAVEDKKRFKVLVPEERPEITLTIGSEAIVVPPDDVVVIPPDDNVTDVVEPPVIPPVTPPVEPPVTPPPIVKIICEDGTEVDSAEDCVKEEEKWGDTLFEQLVTLVGVLLTAIGVQWNRGILGIVRYHWKAGRKAQAMKTLFTLAKRAKEDYYKKKG